MVETLQKAGAPGRTRTTVVDRDILDDLGNRKAPLNCRPERRRRHQDMFGSRTAPGQHYPRISRSGRRFDADPPDGKPPGSDLPYMREQRLDRWEIDIGSLNPLGGRAGLIGVGFGAALSAAVDDRLG